ncbi:extracellular solute-binding protein [Ornithinibacillus gellani]|uniref:extracellular solute-binding protein n=1 Tax=Ornithinibacillus gellani TaxID=2293253 RepID=UPI000F45F68B|nr:extracellular solute-binding protein [Ornithinibacillus gellani]TQS74991.1 extracellular solute-binding protein [Ornithinibacillus gellani]
MKKVYLFSVLILILLLAACSGGKTDEGNSNVEKEDLDNLTDKQFPVVKEPITISMFSASNPNQGDWNDLFIWNEYEKMTNVKVEWEQVPDSTLEEKRNLRLANKDLPDAFYAAGLKNLDLFKYGKQGSFIPLNDLIEKYAPNLQQVLDEYPEVRKAITFPDGNIYALPTIQDPEFLSLLVGARPWYNQEWLDELNMEMPETTEEYYDYLKAVKEDNPGDKNIEAVPYGGRNISELIRWLRGSFGLNAQGHPYIDLDPEKDDLRFIPTSDDYKEMLEYVHKLYDEKLINQNIFTIENDQFLANGANGMYGSTVFYSPDDTFGTKTGLYVGGVPLKGPKGYQFYSKSNAVGRIDGLVITSNAENPAAIVKWQDYFYTEEGSRFQYMGVEGETYEETEDGFEYVDEITNSPDGLTLDEELRKRLAWVGLWPPGIMRQDYFMGSETSEASLEATKKLEPYLSDVSWPSFTYTEDENRILSSAGSDIEKYVQEMRDKFIVGEIPFSKWDDYVKEINAMGLEDYMEVQQNAYDRYSEN